jgi:hypothetical protein
MFSGLLLVAVTAPGLNAQITVPVHAEINHSFVAVTKTLPAGQYTFIVQGNGTSMVIQNSKGNDVELVMVRESIANHTPQNAEIVFRKYGDKEFLSKLYLGGNKTGVAVSGTSKEEEQLTKAGQQPTEHSEVAKK